MHPNTNIHKHSYVYMYVYTQLFIRYKFHDSLRKEKETKRDHHLKEVIRELDIEGMK